MVELIVPKLEILVQAFAPDLVQSCELFSPETIDPVDPSDPSLPPGEDVDLWVPAAPGTTYTNLPQEPVIIDTSPTQMIGCIGDTGDNPQGRLSALFPDAENGDGVIERVTNDIWVFDGSIWNNVGATPGPTMSVPALVPVWNETVIAIAQTRTRVNVQVFDYDLNVVYEIEITTRTTVRTNLVKFVFIPTASILLTARAPGGTSFLPAVLGKVVQVVRYVGTGSSPQFLATAWPVGIAIFGRTSVNSVPLVFDVARGGSSYWQLGSTNPPQTSENAVNFADNGVFVQQNFTNPLNSSLSAWLFRIEKGPFDNQDGSIATTTRNSEAVAIATYTSNGIAGATIGHGLGATPDLCIIKRLTNASPAAGGTSIGGASWAILTNSTGGRFTSTSIFRDFTDTTITLGNGLEVNSQIIDSYVCYSFKEAPNRSKINTYTGNGLSAGLFIDCGFDVGFLLIKPRSTSGSWIVITRNMPGLGRRWSTFASSIENLAQNNFYSLEGKGFRVFNETPNSFGGVDTQLNQLGVEYMYMALDVGFFLKIQCPSVSRTLQVQAVSIFSGVSNKLGAVNYSFRAIPPPYAGKRAVVNAVPIQVFSLVLGQVSLFTGVCIKPTIVIIRLKVQPASYAGETTQDILTHFQVIEQVDSEELESSVKGSILRLVRRLKDQNLWDKIQVINLLCAARTMPGALVPLKGPYPNTPSTIGLFDYNRRTGLRPSNQNFFFATNIFNNDLQVNDNHVSAYVNELNTFGADLIGDGFTTNSLAIGKFTNTPHFDTRNKNSITTRSVEPAWSEPSLVGVVRNNTSNYDQRIARTNRTIAQASIDQSTVTTNRNIFLFSFWNGTGDFRVPVYTMGRAIDMSLLEGEIEIFLADLRAILADTAVRVPRVSLEITALPPERPNVIEVKIPFTQVTVLAIAPLSAGRPRTVVRTALTSFILAVLPLKAGGGSSVYVNEIAVSIIKNDPVIVIREPGFSIGPINLELSDQPTGISLGSFPLQTL
jgi:hypothetical protein